MVCKLGLFKLLNEKEIVAINKVVQKKYFIFFSSSESKNNRVKKMNQKNISNMSNKFCNEKHVL